MRFYVRSGQALQNPVRRSTADGIADMAGQQALEKRLLAKRRQP